MVLPLIIPHTEVYGPVFVELLQNRLVLVKKNKSWEKHNSQKTIQGNDNNVQKAKKENEETRRTRGSTSIKTKHEEIPKKIINQL